jgi:hypothetical protein
MPTYASTTLSLLRLPVLSAAHYLPYCPLFLQPPSVPCTASVLSTVICLLHSHLSPLKPYVPSTVLCHPLCYSVPSVALCLLYGLLPPLQISVLSLGPMTIYRPCAPSTALCHLYGPLFSLLPSVSSIALFHSMAICSL